MAKFSVTVRPTSADAVGIHFDPSARETLLTADHGDTFGYGAHPSPASVCKCQRTLQAQCGLVAPQLSRRQVRPNPGVGKLRHARVAPIADPCDVLVPLFTHARREKPIRRAAIARSSRIPPRRDGEERDEHIAGVGY